MEPDKQAISGRTIATDIPSRLDRLKWSRWHWLIVIALGVTWILDGLQVTLAGAVGGMLRRPEALGLTESQVGMAATFYLAGAVVGALVFGYATDRWGRKKLFYITLSVYLLATGLTACAWNFSSYAFFQFVTGSGIGGEYAAINSAIDELIPPSVRGQVDLIINSTYWIGAMIGAAATIYLLNPESLPVWLGWRLAFAIGAVLGLFVLAIRHWVPESPRWLAIHGRTEEAEKVMSEIEAYISHHHPERLPETNHEVLHILTRSHTAWSEIWQAISKVHLKRSILCLALMGSQAFFYNAIFFTYGLVMIRFYKIEPHQVSWYILPFAVGNVFGPLVLGRFFDTLGRRTMITATYILSGVLLAVTAWLFKIGALDANTQCLAWTIIFFVASAAASSAYLTVSEIFPLEMRAIAIAIFYALGTLVGGVAAPAIFASLIESGSRDAVSWGYLGGAAVMIIAGVVEAFLGVDAEQKSLESITAPLSSLKQQE